MMQTYAFGDGFVLPSYNYDTPRIRACKLFGVQGQSWKRRSSLIANAIKEFSINGKEIEKLNMEMIGSTHRHYKINYKL
jgi:hypothetical protein